MAGVLKFTGFKELKRNLKGATRKYRSATLAAVYEEAQGTMDMSQRQVPIDTGELKDSAFVTKPTLSNPIVVMGYSADHAVPVHERLEVRHPIGKAKFLEDPANKRESGAVRRIARATKRNFEKGLGIRSVPARYATKAPQ